MNDFWHLNEHLAHSVTSFASGYLGRLHPFTRENVVPIEPHLPISGYGANWQSTVPLWLSRDDAVDSVQNRAYRDDLDSSRRELRLFMIFSGNQRRNSSLHAHEILHHLKPTAVPARRRSALAALGACIPCEPSEEPGQPPFPTRRLLYPCTRCWSGSLLVSQQKRKELRPLVRF